MKRSFYLYTTSISLLLLLAIATTAQAGTVTLTGEGVVRFAPDAAHFMLSTQTRGESAEAARKASAKRIAAWEDAAAGFKEDLQDYDDSQVTVNEIVEYDERGRPTDKRYFQASQDVRFDLTDLDLLNQVIAAAESANLSYQLNENSYYSTQSEQLRDSALAAAIDDAKARCQFVAERLGAECGDVETLRVLNQGGHPQPLMMRAMDARKETITQVSDREITANVEASFQLEQ